MKKTCDIFECSKNNFLDGIEDIRRINLVKDIIENQYLIKLLKNKYPIFKITSQYLVQIIRYNNRTRKKTIHEHFPKVRYGKELDKK